MKSDKMEIIGPIENFLQEKLKLEIHRGKLIIRKLSQGIDFLGYVVLPYYCLIRNKTKKRIFRKLKKRREEYTGGFINWQGFNQTLQSYFGVLLHANSFKLRQKIYYSCIGFFHDA